MDVNGVAASIELYLGEDVLLEAGQLVPVQWTGFDTGLRRYQGEVLGKAGIQERFFSKLERAKADRANLEGPGWAGLRAVFAAVFAAFHDVDHQQILEATRVFNASVSLP